MQVELVGQVVVWSLVIGLILYAVAVVATHLFPSLAPKFQSAVAESYGFSIGLPLSAVSSLGVVVFLLFAFPTSDSGSKVLTIKFASMEFTGPAGPVTLWVLCFLTISFSMWLLGGGTPVAGTNQASGSRSTQRESG